MTSTKSKPLTEATCQKALAIVAQYVGKDGYGVWVCHEGRKTNHLLDHTDDGTPCSNGHSGPVPTGYDAYYNGSGIYLNMTWDWPSSGETPTILGESSYLPEDWAYNASMDDDVRGALSEIGVFAEPYNHCALCLYPED